MNKLLFIISFAVAMAMLTTAYADQRIDRDSNNCHIAPDPNDDDAEIDVPCTLFAARVIRYVNVDGVRVANGSLSGIYRVPLGTANTKHPSLVPNSSGDIFLVGSANTRVVDDNYITAAGTQCNLVRSNYQENTGGDDQNQTEYTTNDWDSTVTWVGYETEDGEVMPIFDLNNDEFDYNEDGVVDLSDFSIYRKEYKNTQIGLWKIATNCRNAATQ